MVVPMCAPMRLPFTSKIVEHSRHLPHEEPKVFSGHALFDRAFRSSGALVVWSQSASSCAPEEV